MGLELIIGLGIASALFLYFGFNLNKDNNQHFLLKLLCVFFFLFTLSLVPKATHDAKTTCEYVLNNITTSAPTDYYVYDYECNTTSTATELTFMKTIYWFIRLFGLYFIGYLVYDWARRSELITRGIFGK